MPVYTAQEKEHFLNPRNLGELENPTVIGEAGSMAGGEALKLFLNLDENEVIREARFQVFGSPTAIASCSVLTGLLDGRHIDEAAAISVEDIAGGLGGLPEERMHAPMLALQALESAYARHRGIDLDEAGGDETHICRCFAVTEAQIERAVRRHDITSLAGITHFTRAGGGCQSCHPDLAAILNRVRGAIASEAAAEAAKVALPKPQVVAGEKSGALTNLQRMTLVQEVLDRDIRPGLAMDGGDIELVDIQGPKVFIQLQGHCVSCSSSTATMRYFVEDRLRELVDPAIEVVDVTSHDSTALHPPPMR